MNREQVINIVLNASGWQGCQRAKRVLSEWMQTHPNDWGMLDAGEALEMSLEGLEPPALITNTANKTSTNVGN